LFLILKKKWFDKINSGKKKEEYRLITPFWTKRLLNREYDSVIFQLGYNKKAGRMKFKIEHITIKNITQWETKEKVNVYAIRLGKRIS